MDPFTTFLVFVFMMFCALLPIRVGISSKWLRLVLSLVVIGTLAAVYTFRMSERRGHVADTSQ